MKTPKTVSVSELNRASHFEFYRSFGWPWIDICARVDVTDALDAGKERNVGVFASCLFQVMKAVNSVPALRLRIKGDMIVEYDSCSPSFTVKGQDDLFNFACAEWSDDLMTFASHVKKSSEKASKQQALDLSNDERGDLVFVTCLPWLDFTSIQHPRSLGTQSDSTPRIAWGKLSECPDGRKSMPLSISVHHGLADGLHIAEFLAAI
jgi:chloramphenicol O-acetyltransferase type A